MDSIDLFSLRTHFNRNRILLSFNGPISRSLIEEIGNALRNYLQAENALPAAAMDVFSIYIEMTQNIRHYAQSRGYGDLESAATVIVAPSADGVTVAASSWAWVPKPVSTMKPVTPFATTLALR